MVREPRPPPHRSLTSGFLWRAPGGQGGSLEENSGNSLVRAGPGPGLPRLQLAEGFKG